MHPPQPEAALNSGADCRNEGSVGSLGSCPAAATHATAAAAATAIAAFPAGIDAALSREAPVPAGS